MQALGNIMSVDALANLSSNISMENIPLSWKPLRHGCIHFKVAFPMSFIFPVKGLIFQVTLKARALSFILQK